jgi:hypothetical protein
VRDFSFGSKLSTGFRFNDATWTPQSLHTLPARGEVSQEGKCREGKIMTPHTETAARTRLTTFGNNICPQCNSHLLAPHWSEHVNERCVRHTCSCEACRYEFETAVYFPSDE